jgi:hypothetical protein
MRRVQLMNTPSSSGRAAVDLEAIAGLVLVATSVFSIGQRKAYLRRRGARPTSGAALLIDAGADAS